MFFTKYSIPEYSVVTRISTQHMTAMTCGAGNQGCVAIMRMPSATIVTPV